MEEQQLTLKQQIAYANWSAKLIFNFPWVGRFLVLIAGIFYVGLVFLLFKSEIMQLEFSTTLDLVKFIIASALLIFISYMTVYIPFFIKAFFDKDEICRKQFVKYRWYKK